MSVPINLPAIQPIPILPQSASRYTLGFLRVWVFGVWFLMILTDPFDLVGLLPLSTFRPPGVLQVVPSQLWVWIFTPTFLLGLKILMLTCLAIITVGISRARSVALLTAVLLVFHQGLVRGFGGHMNHAELMLLWAAIILAIFPSFDSFALGKDGQHAQDDQTYTAAVVAIQLFLTLTYHFAGVYRVVNGGIDVFTSDAMKYYLVRNSFLDLEYDWDLGRMAVYDYRFISLIINTGFAGTTVLEILAPICLISRRLSKVWLAWMIAFHILTLFFLNAFWVSALLLVVFLDIGRWLSPWIPQSRHPVVFFDGLCGLCNGFVDWVVSRDREEIFHFAPLQGETARNLLPDRPADPSEWSIVLVDEGGKHYESDAVLRILSRLGGVYRGTAMLLCVPKLFRDGLYRYVASKRYGFFGKLQACGVPSADLVKRFLP